jgi:hypothetical protein
LIRNRLNCAQQFLARPVAKPTNRRQNDMMEMLSCMGRNAACHAAQRRRSAAQVIRDPFGLGSIACEALMTPKPSERIVVFVTPAQKLAITNTADNLGISVSELMRRAVMTFDVTSEQVKVAGIVDRLSAPKAPDPLNVALRQVAERAAAREARDTATAAKNKSLRAQADKAATPGEAPVTGDSALAPEPPEPPRSNEAVPAPPAPSVETARAATAPATADAKAVATEPQSVSMKPSVVLNPFNIATFVRS